MPTDFVPLRPISLSSNLLLEEWGNPDPGHSEKDREAIRELTEENETTLCYGSWNWDPQTTHLDWSHGMYRIMDMVPPAHPQHLKMQHFESFFTENQADRIKALYETAFRCHAHSIKYLHGVVTPLHNHKLLQTTAVILYDDSSALVQVRGITRHYNTASNATEVIHRHKQNDSLSEVFLGHGSWEWNPQAKTASWWSDGMYKLFGYDPLTERDQIIINDALYLQHMQPEVYEKIKQLQSDLLSKQSEVSHLNFEITDRHGESKLLESHIMLIRNEEGTVVRGMGTTRDVTQLRKYEKDLQQKITEINRMSKELEDAAYAASHDLQEPLRKISSLSERLQNKFNAVLPEDGKKYIERIQVASNNARILIDSLMEFSRVTHEGQTYRHAHLNSLLAEVTADLELKIEETYTIIHHDDLPVAEVCSLQIKQLFSNIILNSIKFRKENEPSLIFITSRWADKVEIQSHLLDDHQKYFLISFRDNGIGFEDTYNTKIFQMFSRLNGKSEYPGAGIGLALCKKIVESHQGRIFASSSPREGTIISVLLPEKHIAA